VRLDIDGPGTIAPYDFGIFFDAVDDSHGQRVTVTDSCIVGVYVFGWRNQFNDNRRHRHHIDGFCQGSGADNHDANNTADHNAAGIAFSYRGNRQAHRRQRGNVWEGKRPR